MCFSAFSEENVQIYAYRRIFPMKIALINENSQAAKNGIIEAALKKVVEPMGHEVVNYGMYAADDAAQLTYVQCCLLYTSPSPRDLSTSRMPSSA